MVVQWNVYESFEALLQAGPYHLALEGFFVFCILWLLIVKQPSSTKKIKLTKKEEEELLAEWTPEPLVPYCPSQTNPYLSPRVIEGKIRKYVTLHGKELLNLGSHSYLNLDSRTEIESTIYKTLDQYGVGSCGPRGFYGTTEVHLKLEERLAHFHGCEAAVLYSYGFSTLASAIPAYSKSGDVIFVDECVNFAIQCGIRASRSNIFYFRHNDMQHLEELLENQAKLDKKNLKKAAATRRFLIVEAIYLNSGKICPLPELVELRQKYRLRLFIDESISFGTLGSNARGITDHFNIPMKEVDLIMTSLEFVGSTTGGFTVGTTFVAEHQRLSGLGYCFSASLPPLLAASAIKVLDILEEEGADLVLLLREKCELFHKIFSNLSTKVQLVGDAITPVKHLMLCNDFEDRHLEEEVLRKLVQKAEERGIALVLAVYLADQEHCIPKPSIRLTVCKDLTMEEIKFAGDAVKSTIKEIL